MYFPGGTRLCEIPDLTSRMIERFQVSSFQYGLGSLEEESAFCEDMGRTESSFS